MLPINKFKFIFFAAEIFQCIHASNQNHNFGTDWTVFSDKDGRPHYIDLNVEQESLDDLPYITESLLGKTRFWLYTRKNKDVYEELYVDRSDNSSQFLLGKQVVMVTHGWSRSGNSNSTQLIKDEYLNKMDINVIVVDWYRAALTPYIVASYMTAKVGEEVKDMVLFLIKQFDFDINDLHLIGHSLGAHVMGRAANSLQKHKATVPRVTGLDPARPYFETPTMFPALNKNNAYFVDVIHTNIGVEGFKKAIGHADFYPNGGIYQPIDCTIYKINYINDHNCAFVMYAKSISHMFEANRCNSYYDFKRQNCNGTQLMGMPCSNSAVGKYYLDISNFD